MKSSSRFLLIAVAGIAVIADPQLSHAAAKRSTKTTRSRQHTTEISIESLRAGTLDRKKARKLADTCVAEKRYENAEEVFNKLMVWYPNDDAILKKAAKNYILLSKAELALPIYEKLLKQYPKDSRLMIDAAAAYSWTGRPAIALKLYEKVFQMGNASETVLTKYANMLYLDNQFDKAQAIYLQLAKKKGRNMGESIDLIYKVANARGYTEAGKMLDSIEQRFPGDIGVLETKANLALIRNDFPEALKLSRAVLEKAPENETALLITAEISSWQKDYATSLANYDKIIAHTENSSFKETAFREKGRVLGWMAKYNRAEAQYDDAIRTYPQNETIKAEVAAKKSYFSNAYRTAVKAYNKWIVIEPAQQEPRFDLGQLYMQYGHWNEAAETYDLMLAKAPQHHQAKLAREKIGVLSSMTQIRSGAEYLNVKSEWHLINSSYTGFYTSVYHPFQEHFAGFVDVNSKAYSFEQNSLTPDLKTQLNQKGITAGIEYRSQPDVFVRAAYGFHKNYPNLDDRSTALVEAQSQPIDNLHLGVSFNREEVADNYNTFVKLQLQRNRWRGRVLYTGYRTWNAGADYSLANYSDGNRSNTVGADLTAHLLAGRQQVNATYRFENYGFKQDRIAEYWTPGTGSLPVFRTHSAGVDWRYYFNDELFKGAKDTYVTTSYKIMLEPTGHNVSHQVHAALYHDWNSRLSTALDGQYSWSTTADYQDKMVKAEVQWFF